MADTILDQAPPQSERAEMAVLGSMLLDSHCIPDVIEVLGRDKTCFYRTGHQEIYETIIEASEENEAVDPVVLMESLRRKQLLDRVGGPAYLMSLEESVPTAANAQYYARIVWEKAIKRNLIDTSTQILRESYEDTRPVEDLLDKAEQRIFAIAEKKVATTTVRITDILKSAFDRIDRLQDRKGQLTGLATGFYDLDEYTSGLQNSEMIVVAARPSIGKTSLALNIVEHVGVVEKVPVLMFTLEMSTQQVVENMLCSHARIDAHKMRRGMLRDGEWAHLSLAVGTLSDAPIYLDDTPGMTMLEIRAKARRMKARHGLGLVVIDYLQLMSGRPAENRQQEISEISRSVKSLARELEVPVIAISQLNRAVEAREGHRPRMSDLRESGSIEQDADVILLLHRDDYYNSENNPGKAEIIIAKQRNGPTGRIDLAFQPQFMRFESLSLDVNP